MLSSGRGVVWDYNPANYSTTGNDGYDVRYAYTNATSNNPSLFAGIVYNRSIQTGEFGLIQVWGHCDSIVIHGMHVSTTHADSTGYMIWSACSAFTTTNWNNASITDKVLVPGNVVKDGTTFGYGAMAGVLMRTAYTTINASTDLARNVPYFPHVVPITVLTTCTTTTAADSASVGTIKGFIRCL